MADGTMEELLLSYGLTNVERVCDSTGKETVINHGSYGRILKVLVSGALCAAKEIHYNITIGPGNVYVQQFIREIKLMSQMRHPNVVQFLGVHRPGRSPNAMSPMSPVEGVTLPWLIMEYLPYELHSMLEKPVEFPTPVKIAVLLDISKGLGYLHNNRSSEEIVHRDLSARNILLTASLTAKIADFGVSKRREYNMTMTHNTGNPLYMPPENKPGSAVRYNTKMDIFSFGVIMLFVITKKFPQELLAETYYSEDGGALLARSEVARRQKYFDLIGQSPDDTTHTLVELCRECLDNQPPRRPSADALANRLSLLNIPEDVMAMDKLQLMVQVRSQETGNRPQLPRPPESELNQGDQEAVLLREQVEHLQQLFDNQSRQLTRAQDDVHRLTHESSELQDIRRTTEAQERTLRDQLSQSRTEQERLTQALERKETELRAQERMLARERELAENYQRIINIGESDEQTARGQLQHLNMQLLQMQSERDEWYRRYGAVMEQLQGKEVEHSEQVTRLNKEAAQLKEDLKKKEDDISFAKKKVYQYRDQIQQLQSKPTGEATLPSLPSSGLKTTLALSSSRQQDPTPHGLHSAHCVRWGNKVLYGGAEQARETNHKKSILAYDLDLNKWTVFSSHLQLMHFTMVVVSNKLLLVGGYNDTRNEFTDKISEYIEDHGWVEFGRLPIKRAKAAAIGYRDWLIVAGGCTTNGQSLNQIDALNLAGGSSGWKSLAPLPLKCEHFQAIFYYCPCARDPNKDVAVWYLTTCIKSLEPKQPTMAVSIPDLLNKGAKWLRIPDPPVRSPAITTLRGHLLILGGHETKRRNTISNKVYMYHHGTKEWLPVAEIGNPKVLATCVNVTDSKFMVVGGKDKRSDFSTEVEMFNLPALR